MTADAEGFRYPQIDADRCISCGMCEAVCPADHAPAVSQETSVLAAQNRDEAVRGQSSSGGVFTALARQVLSEDGLVCAAVYDEAHRVTHVVTGRPEELGRMRGAKYAQSAAEPCFPELRDALKKGRSVLFVGTPCQTAGLDRFLGRKYESLLLVDMICHGVPSPLVWEKYLAERRRTDAAGAAVRDIDLRNKETGWSRYAYSVKIGYEDGSQYRMHQAQDPFLRGFVQNLYLRPSCAQCGFKGIGRCSDLTLGDGWGIWDIAPEFDDDKGTSLVLIHTEAGRRAWDAVAPGFRTYPLTAEQAAAQNPSALRSSPAHPERERFFASLEAGAPVTETIRQCLDPPEKRGLLQRIRGKLGF